MLSKAYDPKGTEDQPSRKATAGGSHLPKTYDPSSVEDQIYKMWEGSGAFAADSESGKEPFVISMPPPNATGQLHLGHAVMLALEDIFIRFARMRGKEALWVPGTDHASIATESVVIKKIQDEEGIEDPRTGLGREELVRRIQEYVESSRGTIRGQVRKMGASCDWTRERYTLDPSLARCTNEAFRDMYETGVIYRGDRIVNWDPKLKTTLSDDEVDYQEEQAPFYTFQYGPFQIATARPETKFGDKYVVMHPDDERYKEWKEGDTFECEWINGPVTATVIKDEAIDPEMGTGVMTITPWHDPADFDIAERHGLDREQIIDYDGRLLPVAGEFEGMTIAEARPKVVGKLKEKGLVVKVDENYVHNVAVSSRGKGIVEPQIKRQWFVDVNRRAVPWKGEDCSLKEVMQDVVRSGLISIIPERFEKTYFQWIDNLRDWCISRQIWWGHRIPVYYCSQCGGDAEERGMHVSVQSLTHCPQCGGPVEQDPDTLDTWYGVAQWTWSTLVDSDAAGDFSLSLKEIIEQSPDVQTFHPTDVMETGYDILFFWVARMVLMTTYCLSRFSIGESEADRIPFRTVYLHGLVRTREGKKMSKSDPETMIDPLDIIPRYGADALRLSMIVGQTPGNDTKLYEEKIAGYRNFINKLWNASRFVLMQCEQQGIDPQDIDTTEGFGDLTLADRALLSRLQSLIDEVSDGLQHYRLSETGERLYSFVWDFFCDWYLELSKGEANMPMLLHVLRTLLILLHPYCPFVTEELWSHIKPKNAGMLISHPWPEADDAVRDGGAEQQLQLVMDVISAIRSLRADQGVDAQRRVPAIVASPHAELLESQRGHIERLARLEELTIERESRKHDNTASAVLHEAEVHLPLADLIDVDKERARLQQEKENTESLLQKVRGKLENEQFLQNAPEEVVKKEREKEKNAKEKLEKIEQRLKTLEQ